jgi:hypothetical protein
MKFQYFVEMGQEIRGAVIAGKEMEFVSDAFDLQLRVKGFSAIFKAELVVVAAVEIDGQLCNTRAVLFRQHKRAVLVPVSDIDGITERAEHSAERRSGMHHCIDLPRRFCDEGRALGADRRK